jgi:hypothetical protein
VNWKRTGVVLFVLAWIFAITYSVTAGGTSPERLDDAAARAVETNCRDAQRSLARLPQLDHASVEETAARLEREDEILTAMVRAHRAVKPEKETPTVALRAWLDDWDRLIVAREQFVTDLRTKGAEARFVEPANKGIEPIADTMNDWILEQGTRTETCFTDALQAEVVNGPRTYEKPQ